MSAPYKYRHHMQYQKDEQKDIQLCDYSWRLDVRKTQNIFVFKKKINDHASSSTISLSGLCL